MTYEELQQEIHKLVEQEDATALESFVIDHFQEFPSEIQGQILVAFAEEAIEKQTGEAAIEKLQKEGIEAITQIAALKAILELPPTSQA